MNIGVQELFLISVIALVVLGPERLPTAIKTIILWVNRFKRSFNDIKHTIEKEIDAEEIKRQLHNEEVLHKLGESREQLEELERELLNGGGTIDSIIDNTMDGVIDETINDSKRDSNIDAGNKPPASPQN